MRNHHRFSSFSTFSKRVLGISELTEQKFEKYPGSLTFEYRLNEQGNSTFLVSSLTFQGEEVAQSSYLLADDKRECENTVFPYIEGYTLKHLASIYRILNEVGECSEHVTREHLRQLADLLSVDIDIPFSIEQKVREVIELPRVMLAALNEATDIAILLQCEDSFTYAVLEQFESLIVAPQFVANAPNVRCLQQLLSALKDSAKVLETCSRITVTNDSAVEDAFIAIVLSVSKNAQEAQCVFEAYQLTSISSHIKSYVRVIETLSRSPIKVNYVSELPVLASLLSQLSTERTPHAKLLFRAYYFCEEENRSWLSIHPFEDVLKKVFSFKDSDFNELYRDVRRSLVTPVSKSAVANLLVGVEIDRLSLGKLIYLFSLLPKTMHDSEKLSFLCKGMIARGLPVINSEESLTLCASLGLKNVSNQIINDVLKVNGFLPLLPEVDEYSLLNVFSRILDVEIEHEKANSELVSIVITTFNPNVELLEKAIESLLQQTYRNIEIIVIDDCSAPAISESIEALCRQKIERPIVYYRNNDNVGQYISRNTAIGLAKGEYIAIQDDDDVSHPQRVSAQVKALEEKKSLACFTKHVRYTDDGNLSVDDPRNLLVLGDGPATLLFKRTLIDLIGGFRNYRSRGDIDFRTRIERIAGANAVVRLDVPLYFMRSSLTSVSSMYEYFNGDQLTFFRRRISLLQSKKASEKVIPNE